MNTDFETQKRQKKKRRPLLRVSLSRSPTPQKSAYDKAGLSFLCRFELNWIHFLISNYVLTKRCSDCWSGHAVGKTLFHITFCASTNKEHIRYKHDHSHTFLWNILFYNVTQTVPYSILIEQLSAPQPQDVTVWLSFVLLCAIGRRQTYLCVNKWLLMSNICLFVIVRCITDVFLMYYQDYCVYRKIKLQKDPV